MRYRVELSYKVPIQGVDVDDVSNEDAAVIDALREIDLRSDGNATDVEILTVEELE